MRAAQAGASFHPAALKATGGQGAGRNPVMAGENKQAWSRKPSPLQRTTLQPPQLQECLLTRSRLTEDNEAGENLNSLVREGTGIEGIRKGLCQFGSLIQGPGLPDPAVGKLSGCTSTLCTPRAPGAVVGSCWH
uniref:Uncharacterized protein n=1 Tax=Mus musculus TaxID=10090 RepID=Q9D218_MOUSE|nr:unnamed protein product [Mus musculus]